MVAKTAKTPGFPKKNGKPGAFCVLWVILAYLQLLSSILLILGGGMSATISVGEMMSCFCAF
jgi:hypothetical protein